jgi:hypothetical protein
MPISENKVHTLSAEYPWPTVRPGFNPAEWALGGGGKELVFARIDKGKSFLVLEIGAFLWEFKERLFPVRGKSPEKLYDLANMGVKLDLVYFDSNKTGDDIDVVHHLFPDAILTGDDWTWGLEQDYPIRASVRKFAHGHNFKIVSDRATWVLVKGSLNTSERVKNLMSFARDQARALRRVFR